MTKKSPNDAVILFQGTTVIHGDVVYQKVERESDGTWEHKVFYINLVGKDGKTAKIWEHPYQNVKRNIWLAVQPMVLEFINVKCEDGWELVSNLADYDDVIDFNTGTDVVRWIAEFALSLGTGVTDVNAYWTEARGARVHFRRKVMPS